MADPVGFQGDIPAALLFIEATAEQIHLPMQLALRMIALLLTAGTLTNSAIQQRHEQLLGKQRVRRSLIVRQKVIV
jgi:hypothetical protein